MKLQNSAIEEYVLLPPFHSFPLHVLYHYSKTFLVLLSITLSKWAQRGLFLEHCLISIIMIIGTGIFNVYMLCV